MARFPRLLPGCEAGETSLTTPTHTLFSLHHGPRLSLRPEKLGIMTAEPEHNLTYLEEPVETLNSIYVEPDASTYTISGSNRSSSNYSLFETYIQIQTVLSKPRAFGSHLISLNEVSMSLEVVGAHDFWIGRETHLEGDEQNNIVSRTSRTTSITSSKSGLKSLPPESSWASSNVDKKRVLRDEDGDNSSDRDKRFPKHPRNDPELDDVSFKFACPYRKHDPVRYSIHGSNRACALNYWKNVSRIKEHLYRAHRAPIQCRRCGLNVKTEDDLTAHSQAAIPCNVTPLPRPEGITQDVEKKLRSRKRTSPLQNEAERWKEIYQIIFPGEEVPGPYFEPVQEENLREPNNIDLNDYENFSNREYPQIIRSALERYEINHARFSDTWIDDMVETLQNCQQELMLSYRTRHVAATTTEQDTSTADLASVAVHQPLPPSSIDTFFNFSETFPYDTTHWILPETDFHFLSAFPPTERGSLQPPSDE